MPQEVDKNIKKTRRRLRVSCVECTRRRQKCDRSQPCGLCKRRGVEHLCRWELEPFARPPPSRPQGARKPSSNKHVQKKPPQVSGKRGEASPSSTVSNFLEARNYLEHEVKEAAIALAQLSVARHGEYLGTGSLVCALHGLNDSTEAKIPIDKSSGTPFSARSQYSSAVSNMFLSTLQVLVSDFPDKSRCDALITDFFEHDNWRYGLPEALILSVYKSMWETIETDERSVERINFNWVTFLFAMFSLSSSCESEKESRKYFLQGLTAKRLAEDVQYASFFTPRDSGTFSQGTAHGCIAASLMAEYMCGRGQLTEAWKLIGSAVRNAQNAGLHLNPGWSKWKGMTGDEQTLRTLGWHMCAAKDRFLSFALGRPGMVRSREFYVPIEEPVTLSLTQDGTSNTACVYQVYLTCLIENVSEEKDKYLSVRPDPSDGGKSFRCKMAAWEKSLPIYLSLQDPDTSFDHTYPMLQMQRSLIASHYYFCCMLFHRSLPCVKLIDRPTEDSPNKNQWDFDRLSRYAIDLLDTQRAFLKIMKHRRQTCFIGTYFIFEAAVTLCIAICRNPDNSNADEWRKERDTAIELLQEVLEMDNSELAQQAIIVLRILQDRPPCDVDSLSIHSTNKGSTGDSHLPNPSGFGWPFIEPQSTTLSPMFLMDALQLQDAVAGNETHAGLDSSLTLSSFDFLFNAAAPR